MFIITRAVAVLVGLVLFSCGKLEEKPKPAPFADTISAVNLRFTRGAEMELAVTGEGAAPTMSGRLDFATHAAKLAGAGHNAEVKCADVHCEQAEIVLDGATRILHRLHKGLKFRGVGTPRGEGLQARVATALQGVATFEAGVYVTEIGTRQLFAGYAKFGRKTVGFSGVVREGARVRLVFDDGLRSEEKTYAADVLWYAEDLRLSVAFTEGSGLPVLSLKP